MLGHSQTKGRDNREPKLRPKPARQSSTLLMSGDWKRNYGTNCDTGMGESRRQTVQPRSLRPPRQSSNSLLTEYNEARPHQGRYCFGKTPMQTFLDARTIAQEKQIGEQFTA